MRRLFEHWLARTALRSSLLSCWQKWLISSRLYGMRAVRRFKAAWAPTQLVASVPLPLNDPWADMSPKEPPRPRTPQFSSRRSSADSTLLPSIGGGNAAAAGGDGGAGKGEQPVTGAGAEAGKDALGEEDEDEDAAVKKVDPLARIIVDVEVDGGGQMYVCVAHMTGCPLLTSLVARRYDRFVSAQLDDMAKRQTMMDAVAQQNEAAAAELAAEDGVEPPPPPGDSSNTGTDAPPPRAPPKNLAQMQLRKKMAIKSGTAVQAEEGDLVKEQGIRRGRRRSSVLGARAIAAVGSNEMGFQVLKNRRASTFQYVVCGCVSLCVAVCVAVRVCGCGCECVAVAVCVSAHALSVVGVSCKRQLLCFSPLTAQPRQADAAKAAEAGVLSAAANILAQEQDEGFTGSFRLADGDIVPPSGPKPVFNVPGASPRSLGSLESDASVDAAKPTPAAADESKVRRRLGMWAVHAACVVAVCSHTLTMVCR